MEQIRVNIRTTVNAKAIRREMLNGREHLVVPSFTLPEEVVMNGGLYPKDEIDKSYASLEGTLAPLGHPQIDGEYVSAREPAAINAYHIGAWNRNVKKVGKRVSVEKWLDVEFAKNTEGGRQVLAAVDKGQPIHTSTGIFLEREEKEGDGYDWIARNMQFDHDAILLSQPGAATPDQGVGMLVNKQLVINCQIPEEDMRTNEDALKDSYGEMREKLNAVVKDRYASEDAYAFVEDFDDEAAVVCVPNRMFKVRYSLVDGNPVLGEEVGDVVAKTEYEMKTNRLKDWFKSLLQWNSKQTEPVIPENETEEISDMKPEELGEVKAAMAANAESALAGKRKVVAEKLGEVVANALQGEALEDAYARCSTAAPLVAGLPQTNAADDQWKDYDINAHMEAK